MELTEEQFQRYARHLILPEVGGAGPPGVGGAGPSGVAPGPETPALRVCSSSNGG